MSHPTIQSRNIVLPVEKLVQMEVEMPPFLSGTMYSIAGRERGDEDTKGVIEIHFRQKSGIDLLIHWVESIEGFKNEQLRRWGFCLCSTKFDLFFVLANGDKFKFDFIVS